MNTPAHVATSLLIWRREPGWGAASAVTLGALLPDLPMFGFYVYQRVWSGRGERVIWSQLYFQDDWQFLFDLFNSIPIAFALFAVCYFRGFRWGWLLAASAMVHMLCDLPVHHDDAHGHFLPLTSWRFASPVSYWDPRHYGHIFIWLELIFAVGACMYVVFKGKHWPLRFVALGTLTLYAAGIGFAIAMWSSLL